MIVRLSVLLALVLGVALFAAGPGAADPLPPQMHTVAGSGSCSGTTTSGGPCDNVSATSVTINDARSVSPLPGGGFLFVDANAPYALAGGVSPAGLVREVTPKGKVITVAGNGTATDAPDGTAAVQSGLDGPVSVAALPAGGFLVTEYNGAVVRMVSSLDPTSSTIETIAGTGTAGDNGPAGSATSIELNYPSDAELTPDGRVLVADTGNDVIRALSAAAPGATVSTIAGGGACDDRSSACDGLPAGAVALHDPVSVSPVADGSLLIAEADSSGANAVREVSPSGTFTTVAGVPGRGGGFGGDGGPATAALLNSPEQVVSVPSGGFLIADTHNEVIRQVSPSGTITTIAGNGVATYAGDGGDATAASFENPTSVALYPYGPGELLIADENDGAIREVTLPPVTSIAFGPAAQQGQNGWYTVAPVTATVSTTEKATLSCESDPPQPPPVFAAIQSGCVLSGAGGQITGDGIHTIWAAASNSAGDAENPVSATVKIDTTSPAMGCVGKPTFPFGTRGATVSASVADAVSGVVAPIVSAVVGTRSWGVHTAALEGRNGAGTPGYAYCDYTVLPLAFTPPPELHDRASTGRGPATVRRLVVSRVARGAAVNIGCRGTGCPFTLATDVTGRRCHSRPCRAARRARSPRVRSVDLAPLLAGARLAPDARVTVSVTAANTIGRQWTLTPGGARRVVAACLTPGSLTRPHSCSPQPARTK